MKYPEPHVQTTEIIRKVNTIKPLVAISCITYNHENYIRDALEGFVRQQTSFPFITIVHDDASTDNTAEIIKEYAERYPDIILPIYENENQYRKGGFKQVSQNIDYIIKESKAKYIALCEGDDYWTDRYKLQKQVNALESNPDCSICLGKVNTIDKYGNQLEMEIPYKSFIFPEKVTLNHLSDSQFKQGIWAFHTSCYFFRSLYFNEYIEATKTYLKNFPYGDLPLLIFYLIKGKGYYINTPMSNYRSFSGGYTSSMINNPSLCIGNEKKVIQAFYDLDEATNHEYHEQFIFRIIQGEFKIARITHKIKPLFKKEFIPAYKEWGIKRTLKEIIPIAFNQLYKIYRKIKGRR